MKTSQLTEVVTRARILLAKLDIINKHPSFRGVFQCAQNHHSQYDGPTYNVEIADLRAALDALDKEEMMKPTPPMVRIEYGMDELATQIVDWVSEHPGIDFRRLRVLTGASDRRILKTIEKCFKDGTLGLIRNPRV